MVSAPYGSMTSEIRCNVANIHNHRHYCKHENCRWHNLRSPRKVFSLIILPQKTSLVCMDGSMSFVTPFLTAALTSALCKLQIRLLRNFTFRPPPPRRRRRRRRRPPPPPTPTPTPPLYHMKCCALCHKDQLWDHSISTLCGVAFSLLITSYVLLRAIVSSWEFVTAVGCKSPT